MSELTVNDYIYVKLVDLYDYLTSYNYPSIMDDIYTFFPNDLALENRNALGFSSDNNLKDYLDNFSEDLKLYFSPTSEDDKLLEDYQPNIYDLLYNQSVATGTQDLIDKLDEFNGHFEKLENFSMCILFVITISFGYKCLKSVVTQLLRM